MDVSGSSLGAMISNQDFSQKLGNKVLNKALDIQVSNAAQLIKSVNESVPKSSGGGLGSNIDVKV